MNESILGYPLNEGEKVLLQLKPHPKIVWAWMLTKTSHINILTVGLLVWFIYPHLGQNVASAMMHQQHIMIALLITLVTTIILISSYLSYLWLRRVAGAYDYVITNQRCLLRYGMLQLNTRIIPISQINDVNIVADVILNSLQLENVFIDTLSTAYANMRPDMLNNRLNNSTLMEGLTTEQSREAVTILSQLITKSKN